MLCAHARVDSHRLRKGTLTGDDMDKLLEAGSELRSVHLYIDDSPQQGVADRIGTARLDGDGDLLADPGELLRHPVPAGEHRVFSGFEDASHGGESSLTADVE